MKKIPPFTMLEFLEMMLLKYISSNNIKGKVIIKEKLTLLVGAFHVEPRDYTIIGGGLDVTYDLILKYLENFPDNMELKILINEKSRTDENFYPINFAFIFKDSKGVGYLDHHGHPFYKFRYSDYIAKNETMALMRLITEKNKNRWLSMQSTEKDKIEITFDCVTFNPPMLLLRGNSVQEFADSIYKIIESVPTDYKTYIGLFEVKNYEGWLFYSIMIVDEHKDIYMLTKYGFQKRSEIDLTPLTKACKLAIELGLTYDNVFSMLKTEWDKQIAGKNKDA